MDHEPTSEEAPFDLQLLLKPQSYKVRLYILQATKLTPMDPGWGGRPGKSDPYLSIKLGKEKFSNRKDYVEDATDVDFYTCVELNAELPGAGQLEVKVMDYDTFGTDDLIGRTVIDLEDRWFDDRWHQLGASVEERDPVGLKTNKFALETPLAPLLSLLYISFFVFVLLLSFSFFLFYTFLYFFWGRGVH